MDDSLNLGLDDLEDEEINTGWAPSDEGPTDSDNESDSNEVLPDHEDIVSSYDDTELLSSVQALTESNETLLQSLSIDLKTNNELLSALLIALVAFFALSIIRRVYDHF